MACPNPRHTFMYGHLFDSNDLELCQTCGKGYPRVNAVDLVYGCTPLILVCRFHDSPDAVRALLSAGADVEEVDRYGNTPIKYAAKVPNRKMYMVLEDHKIKRWKSLWTPNQRAEVVACTGIVLPSELAELCGDFVYMDYQRLKFNARLERTHE